MHNAIKEAILAHQKAEEHYKEMYRVIKMISDATKNKNVSKQLTQEERADLIYFCKQLGELHDDLGKEARAARELLDNVLCAVYIGTTAAKERSVKGDIAIATPDLKVQGTCPSSTKEPTRYRMLMEFCGVKNEIIEAGLLTAHWPKMVEYLTKCATEGIPFPDGIDPDNTKPKYSTAVRLRSDVDLTVIREGVLHE